MKRTLLAALLATGTLVSAQSFATGIDENDLSWLYVPPTAKQWPADSGKSASPSPVVRYGDENNRSSWLYAAPTAKQYAADSGKPASPSPIAHIGDENDLSWLYVPPSARPSRYASTPTTPAR